MTPTVGNRELVIVALTDKPVSHRRVWRLAWPVIVSNISVPMLSAVDTAVVGRLPGAQYLGAVAVGSLVFSVMFAGFNFLRMGTTGLTAQAVGAKEPDQVASWFGRSVLLAVIVAAIVLVFQRPLVWLALFLVKASPEVTELAGIYFSIRVWALPAALINLACTGWFFGIHETRTALWVQIFLNVLNMILDIVFVLGLHWGVEGAASATVVSEFTTAVLSLWLVRIHLKRKGGKLVWSRIRDTHALSKMMRVNRDIFLRSCCLQAALFTFTSTGARLGEVTLAANAVLMTLQNMASYGMDGLANVAEIMAGEAFGAKNRTRLRAVIVATAKQSAMVAVLFSCIWWLFGTEVVNLLTNIEDVRAACVTYLPWNVVLPLVAVWCFLLDGVFIGTTHTRAMRNSMASSLAFFLVAVGVLMPTMGNQGLWLSFTLFNLARGVTMAMALPALFRQLPMEIDTR